MAHERIYVTDYNFTVMPAKSVAVTPENTVKETDKAILLECKRILSTRLKQDDNERYYFVVFSDQVWVPKSQISDTNTVATWFVKNNEIYSA